MTAGTACAVEARSQAGAGLDVTGNGVHFPEGGTKIGEIVRVNSRNRFGDSCHLLAHPRIPGVFLSEGAQAGRYAKHDNAYQLSNTARRRIENQFHFSLFHRPLCALPSQRCVSLTGFGATTPFPLTLCRAP